jgi:aspartyl-tRNA(Asn)/glutamyl-tRNA(Gln) amidotransferase subunit A
LNNMLSAKDIINKTSSGEITVSQIVKNHLTAIDELNPKLNAFVEVFTSESINRAQELDTKLQNKEPLGRLFGLPIAIKDNMLFAGHKASSSSEMLKDYTASYSSTVVARLLAEDAIIIGRTNMDEFAMGSSNETSAFGNVVNPWGENAIPGGSSGGAAVAVAAGMVSVALGSDTGGSIRQPASMCNLVGLKPTYGRVSRYGLMAMASSLDQIGPLAKTVEDCALIMSVIEGKDESDATTIEIDNSFSPALQRANLQNLKIGVPKQYFIDGLDSEVRKTIFSAIDQFKSAGSEIVEVDIPLLEYALPVYYILQPAEASSNLARYDGLRYGTRSDANNLLDSYLETRGDLFGTEVKRRILLGTYILSAGYYDAYYKKALAVRSALHAELEDVYKSVDVLLGPTSPVTAWKIGEKKDDPVAMYLSDIFSVTANIVGLPSISVPAGFANGLPVGMQLMASAGKDVLLLEIAHAFQQINNSHLELPR